MDRAADRERLGEPVRCAVVVEVLRNARERGDRRVRLDLPHAREIAPRGARVLGERLLLVGPRVQGRRALALDHRERRLGLEGLLHEQARARRERSADRHRDSGRPEERIGRVDPVRGREAQHVGEAVPLEHGGALRVQHALRLRRGARGVDDQAVVARLHRAADRVEQRVGDVATEGVQALPGLDAAARLAEAEADHAPQVRQRRRAQPARRSARELGVRGEQIVEEALLAERDLHQERGRIAVAQDVVALGRAREGVHGHQHRAHAGDGVRRDDPLRTVRHPHRHARALDDARADQRARQLARRAPRAPRR